jgi:wobble nucleotide-excising tRNase
MLISRIIKIKDCPSFIHFEPNNSLPEFKKYNLIYGWNGSGKTSFSRILRSFELKENYYKRPDRSPEFEFKLNNENSINQDDLTSFSNIRVFNKDFINDSVFGTNGPKPIFFLGKESKEDREKITKIEDELNTLRKKRDSEKASLDKAKTNKDKMLSEKAKNIKNTLTTSINDEYRNYERPNLEKMIRKKFGKLINPVDFKLDEDRLIALQSEIQQTTKPTISALEVPNFEISHILVEVKDNLQKTVITQTIEALKSDDIISKWVEHGLTIHREKDLIMCAFCNQIIPQDRLKDLENHFNDDYQKLLGTLRHLKEKLASKKIKADFLDASNFYNDLTNEYLFEKKKAENSIVTFNKNLDTVISVLEKKEQNPFSGFNLEDLPLVENTSFKEINEIIAKHNNKTENFKSEVTRNKKELEIHYIAEFISTYNELTDEVELLENENSNLEKTISEKEEKIDELKKNLISHYIPATRISEDLEQFLGRDDIQVKPNGKQKGYQITRNGERVGEKDLSEGEKTALAIVYFLTKINEEGFNLHDSLIVVDDPVSSLDSSAIFQAFGFIKESIKEAGQIIILTHHFDFFRQVKNWFSHYKKNEREFFMVACKKENSIRKSTILKIDDLLINYESEYHFLFSVLYKFTKENEQHLEEMYPLPNIARKFLESFMAFRIPIMPRGRGEPVLFNRLKKINFDSKKKERIRRFVDTHSHPRYEGGVQDFDMTILGETPDILNDLLDLVECEDKKHYDFLVESITAS